MFLLLKIPGTEIIAVFTILKSRDRVPLLHSEAWNQNNRILQAGHQGGVCNSNAGMSKALQSLVTDYQRLT